MRIFDNINSSGCYRAARAASAGRSWSPGMATRYRYLHVRTYTGTYTGTRYAVRVPGTKFVIVVY